MSRSRHRHRTPANTYPVSTDRQPVLRTSTDGDELEQFCRVLASILARGVADPAEAMDTDAWAHGGGDNS